MDKLNLLYQYGAITNAAQSLEIDPTDCRQAGGRFAFLFSKHDANRVAARCLTQYGFIPTLILSDVALPPAGKGMQWIMTNESEPSAAHG
jgi:hypothetical protein